MAGKRNLDVAFEPTANSSLASYAPTKDHVILNVLEDVKNRVYVLTQSKGVWEKRPLEGAPQFGNVSVSPIDADESNEYFMTSTDFVTPTTLYYGSIGKQPEQLKQ
jgi:prolyl oligopeptidase